MFGLPFTQIKETCLYVNDVEAMRAFYHEKLKLPVVSFVPETLVFFRAGSSVLLCFNPEKTKDKPSPPPHGGEGDLHFAFEVPVEFYEPTKAFVKAQGIEIEDEVYWRSGLYSFYFRDPENNCLEIIQAGVWDYA